MAAKKGNKHAGSRKGIPNKRTKEAIERVEWVLGVLEETLEADLKKLSPSQKTLMWKDLQEYVRPKLQRTTLVGDETQPIILNIEPASKGK